MKMIQKINSNHESRCWNGQRRMSATLISYFTITGICRERSDFRFGGHEWSCSRINMYRSSYWFGGDYQ